MQGQITCDTLYIYKVSLQSLLKLARQTNTLVFGLPKETVFYDRGDNSCFTLVHQFWKLDTFEKNPDHQFQEHQLFNE